MNLDVAVDVGNTRIKWGRCNLERVTEVVSLPPEDPGAWQEQRQLWALPSGATWCLSGVHPHRCQQLEHWLGEQGEHVIVLNKACQLPLQVGVPEPDRVGIDRLLDAVAAGSHLNPEAVGVIIDAGSAVTVDQVVVAEGITRFGGGAILPGLRLMAQALHSFTALLPLVAVTAPAPPLGLNTPTAMQAGIWACVLGGIEHLLQQHKAAADTAGMHLQVFVTGGDGKLIADALQYPSRWWPEMTLEGVRLSATNPLQV